MTCVCVRLIYRKTVYMPIGRVWGWLYASGAVVVMMIVCVYVNYARAFFSTQQINN